LNTLIRFLVLNSDTRQKLICEVAEKFYSAGKKVIIRVKDAEEGNEIDRLLWIWKQSSFVPHLFTQHLNYTIPEPVVLTTQIEANPGFDILMLADPVPLDTVLKFAQVIDFAEKYDTTLLNLSRNRFKLYREHKLKIETWQPSEFLAADIK
jgi:DNA polymerase III subunit chi